MDRNALQHFGILGMKWGVRRSPDQLGRASTSKGKASTKVVKIASEDYAQSRAMIEKGSKSLSTKELSDLTRRLQLERQYKDLKPSDFKKGMDFVKTITAAGTAAGSVYALIKSPLAQSIKDGIIKAIQINSEAQKMKWLV